MRQGLAWLYLKKSHDDEFFLSLLWLHCYILCGSCWLESGRDSPKQFLGTNHIPLPSRVTAKLIMVKRFLRPGIALTWVTVYHLNVFHTYEHYVLYNMFFIVSQLFQIEPLFKIYLFSLWENIIQWWLFMFLSFFPSNKILILHFDIFMSSSSCFIFLLLIATLLTKFSPPSQH